MHILAAYNIHSLLIPIHCIALTTGCLMMSTNCATHHYVILCVEVLSCPWEEAVFLNVLFSFSLVLTSILCILICTLNHIVVTVTDLTT
jgi:hypothetical protein